MKIIKTFGEVIHDHQGTYQTISSGDIRDNEINQFILKDTSVGESDEGNLVLDLGLTNGCDYIWANYCSKKSSASVAMGRSHAVYAKCTLESLQEAELLVFYPFADKEESQSLIRRKETLHADNRKEYLLGLAAEELTNGMSKDVAMSKELLYHMICYSLKKKSTGFRNFLYISVPDFVEDYQSYCKQIIVQFLRAIPIGLRKQFRIATNASNDKENNYHILFGRESILSGTEKWKSTVKAEDDTIPEFLKNHGLYEKLSAFIYSCVESVFDGAEETVIENCLEHMEKKIDNIEQLKERNYRDYYEVQKYQVADAEALEKIFRTKQSTEIETDSRKRLESEKEWCKALEANRSEWSIHFQKECVNEAIQKSYKRQEILEEEWKEEQMEAWKKEVVKSFSADKVAEVCQRIQDTYPEELEGFCSFLYKVLEQYVEREKQVDSLTEDSIKVLQTYSDTESVPEVFSYWKDRKQRQKTIKETTRFFESYFYSCKYEKDLLEDLDVKQLRQQICDKHISKKRKKIHEGYTLGAFLAAAAYTEGCSLEKLFYDKNTWEFYKNEFEKFSKIAMIPILIKKQDTIAQIYEQLEQYRKLGAECLYDVKFICLENNNKIHKTEVGYNVAERVLDTLMKIKYGIPLETGSYLSDHMSGSEKEFWRFLHQCSVLSLGDCEKIITYAEKAGRKDLVLLSEKFVQTKEKHKMVSKIVKGIVIILAIAIIVGAFGAGYSIGLLGGK